MFELRNLARDPASAATRERLANALETWRLDVGDLGDLPESEMVRQWYPAGKQPQTAAPIFIPIDDDHIGREVARGECLLQSPALLQLHTATQGASIGYTFDDGPEAAWSLYTEPIRLPKGESTIRAKAIRIGYAESDEVSVELKVE